jgi:hypothetical protein
VLRQGGARLGSAGKVKLTVEGDSSLDRSLITVLHWFFSRLVLRPICCARDAIHRYLLAACLSIVPRRILSRMGR